MDAATLHEVLCADRESELVEFEESFDFEEPRQRLALVRNMVAVANSGGGAIVVGVDDGGRPTGDASKLLALDPMRLARILPRYTGARAPRFEIREATKEGRPVAVIAVEAADVPLVFERAGRYAAPGRAGGRASAFPAGGLYFRRGAESRPGTTAELREAFERLRAQWNANIDAAKAAPPGAQVAVLEPVGGPSEAAGVTSVRITDDPEAAAYRVVDPDESHPYRTKEIAQKIREGLPPHVKFSWWDVVGIRVVLGLDDRPDLVYRSRRGPSPQFSAQFAAWVLTRIAEEPDFLEKTRDAHREYQRRKSGRGS